MFDTSFVFRIGQQALDDEFLVTDGTDLFLHSAAGNHFNITLGAPLWPAASTAIYGRYEASRELDLELGAFHADFDNVDDTDTNRDGLRFGWDATETLYIAQARFERAGPSERSDVVKLGAWYDTNRFEDFSGRDDHDHGLGAFLAADHAILRAPEPFAEEVRAVVQYGWSPDDRTPLDVDLTIGLTAFGLIDGRDADAAGIAYLRPRLSRELRRSRPGSRTESAIELTYRAEVRPGFSMQGSLQYVDEPGGAGASDFDDAFVLGLRTELRF